MSAFSPSLWSTLLVCTLIPTFISLGQWQLGKAHVKEAAQAQLEGSRHDAPVILGRTLIDDPASLHLRPIQTRGLFDAKGQILIDNRVMNERNGYHVLTPLLIEGGDSGGMRVMVNRGWIPAPPTRAETIDVPVPTGPVTVTGTAWLPSTKIFALAPDTAPPGGNARWQNLDLVRYRTSVPHPVQPLVILLAPEASGGFAREWPRPDERHERHRSYAYQWFGFAGSAALIWAWFALRRRPAPAHPAPKAALGAP